MENQEWGLRFRIRPLPKGGPFLGLYRFRGLVLVLLDVKMSEQFRFVQVSVSWNLSNTLEHYRTHFDIAQCTWTLRSTPRHCAI